MYPKTINRKLLFLRWAICIGAAIGSVYGFLCWIRYGKFYLGTLLSWISFIAEKGITSCPYCGCIRGIKANPFKEHAGICKKCGQLVEYS